MITTDDFNLLKIYVGKKEKYKKKHVPPGRVLCCSCRRAGLFNSPLASTFSKVSQLPKRTLRFEVDEDESDYTVMETLLKSSNQ